MLKIVSGEYKSRQLHAPPDAAISRPYPHRVREAVFNLLRGWCDDASVLDLFAGVGSMGLEAISRGATSVLMVEQDRQIHGLLERNIEELGCEDRAQAMRGDALAATCLLRARQPVDLIFVDPPYPLMTTPESRQTVLDQIARCRSVMGDRGFVVLRSPSRPEGDEYDIPGFDGPEERDYGKGMWVLLYAPAPASG